MWFAGPELNGYHRSPIFCDKSLYHVFMFLTRTWSCSFMFQWSEKVNVFFQNTFIAFTKKRLFLTNIFKGSVFVQNPLWKGPLGALKETWGQNITPVFVAHFCWFYWERVFYVLMSIHKVIKLQKFKFSVSDVIQTNVQNILPFVLFALFGQFPEERTLKVF